jgi:hypothetical protein
MTPGKAYNNIEQRIYDALKSFSDRIPALNDELGSYLLDEISRFDRYTGGQIKPSVKNMNTLTSIKNKMLRIILTPKYVDQAREFMRSYNDISSLQNQYWKLNESRFKPTPMLREIKNLAITTTADKLGEQGIGVGVGDKIMDILRTNVTSGGTYKQLREQLKVATQDTETPSVLRRYLTQVTTDSINQYNAQYTQQVSNDLGYQWYAYQGSDIMTTRPFCNAMTDFRYFHVSEVPRLLRAEDLYYIDPKTQERKKVAINPKTKLPAGMIEGTTPENFFIRRGGWNCAHQIRPVSERLVPLDIRDRVYNSSDYQIWAQKNVAKPKTTVKEKQEETKAKIEKRSN